MMEAAIVIVLVLAVILSGGVAWVIDYFTDRKLSDKED